MKAPRFWQDDKSALAKMLLPLARIYGEQVQKRLAKKPNYTSKLPVICVGNVVMGGSGKTPVVQALAKLLQEKNQTPAIVLRGYGGEKNGPAWITDNTPVKEYGDEALLHARIAPTMVSADRAIGARAIETNADVTQIIMDDGLQNPSLQKTLSLLVLDGDNPFGNGYIFPAGPLRETAVNALKRVQAAIVLGNDPYDLTTHYQFLLPVFRASLRTINGDDFKGKPVIAFAGIGRPQKFFDSLRASDAVLIETHGFADHHPYTAKDILPLLGKAQTIGATLVTTRKDWVRLPPDVKEQTAVLDVELAWQDKQAISEFLQQKLSFNQQLNQ